MYNDTEGWVVANLERWVATYPRLWSMVSCNSPQETLFTVINSLTTRGSTSDMIYVYSKIYSECTRRLQNTSSSQWKHFEENHWTEDVTRTATNTATDKKVTEVNMSARTMGKYRPVDYTITKDIICSRQSLKRRWIFISLFKNYINHWESDFFSCQTLIDLLISLYLEFHFILRKAIEDGFWSVTFIDNNH